MEKICKQCGNKYDENRVERVYGSLPVIVGVCSSYCYTRYIMNKNKGEINSEKIFKAFKELLMLVDNCADFSNGVDFNGLDEGRIKCRQTIDDICKKYFNKTYNEIIKGKKWK